MAYLDDEGRVTVEVAGQWTHEDQEQIAHALGLPLEQIRVIYPAIGGAFGGREDMSVQIVLALAAWRLSQRGIRRPVKSSGRARSRSSGITSGMPITIRSKWGATRQGRLWRPRSRSSRTAAPTPTRRPRCWAMPTLMCTGPYEFPNVTVDAYSVYTNNIPGGAFRGFGGPQGAFAAEMQMNLLAEALGMDPVEIRSRNVLREGALLSVGTPLPKGVSIDHGRRRVRRGGRLESGPEKGGGRVRKRWASRRRRTCAAAWDSPAGSRTSASRSAHRSNPGRTVELHGEARSSARVVYHAGAECGQGAHTVMAQMAAEAARRCRSTRSSSSSPIPPAPATPVRPRPRA